MDAILAELAYKHGGLLLPAILAYVTTKQAYPYFLKSFKALCERAPWLKNYINIDFCIGCLIVFYSCATVLLTVVFKWLIQQYPGLVV